MGKITFKSFFNGVKKTIEEDKKIDIQIKNLIKKDDFNFNDYFKNCSNTLDIIPILQKVNEYFIKNCEIHIDDLKIYPVETEIYFANDLFYDGMCHMNELQRNNKDRFGKLYFHRYKDTEDSEIRCIKTKIGGMDICLSDTDKNNTKYYYLSILIRSAFINGIGEDNLFSGINNICKEIIKKRKQKDFESIKKDLKENIEKKIVLYNREQQNINMDNIFFQKRIVKTYYSKCIDLYKLNCLNLGKDYKYLNIIKEKQNFYKKQKNIKIIKNDFENKRN